MLHSKNKFTNDLLVGASNPSRVYLPLLSIMLKNLHFSHLSDVNIVETNEQNRCHELPIKNHYILQMDDTIPHIIRYSVHSMRSTLETFISRASRA